MISCLVMSVKSWPTKTPLEALAEEAPPRAEIAKSTKPSVLQKLSDMKGMDHATGSLVTLKSFLRNTRQTSSSIKLRKRLLMKWE